MAKSNKQTEGTTRTEKKKGKIPSPVKKPTQTVKTNHPPVSEMVKNAIHDLNEHRGSSLYAIKKYMEANYEVEITRIAPFIKKHLKSAVINGNLIQTKGKGASGSFKLPKIKAAKKTAEKKSKPMTIKENLKKKKEEKEESSEESEESLSSSSSESENDSPKKLIEPKLTAAKDIRKIPIGAGVEKKIGKQKTKIPPKDIEKTKPSKSKQKTSDENIKKTTKGKKADKKKQAESEEDAV